VINNDPVTNMTGDVSLHKEQVGAGTLTGDWIDCSEMLGPNVVSRVMTGEVTGEPDSQSSTFTLLEADASDGTGSQAISAQSDAVVITSDKGFGYLRGSRTKRYVAVKCVLVLPNGTSPKQSCFATVEGEKIHK
jgi:hypothetical protein